MLSIRAATIADVPLLRSLIQELAEYERESQEVFITEEQLRRNGFGPDPIFRAIIAEQDGQPAGFAVFFTSFSTWTGSGLFLEDLFVRETFRGHGVGKALVCQVAEIARKEGHHTIRFGCLALERIGDQVLQVAWCGLPPPVAERHNRREGPV
jgi:GNAT superfamily N-acetyltransferase